MDQTNKKAERLIKKLKEIDNPGYPVSQGFSIKILGVKDWVSIQNPDYLLLECQNTRTSLS